MAIRHIWLTKYRKQLIHYGLYGSQEDPIHGIVTPMLLYLGSQALAVLIATEITSIWQVLLIPTICGAVIISMAYRKKQKQQDYNAKFFYGVLCFLIVSLSFLEFVMVLAIREKLVLPYFGALGAGSLLCFCLCNYLTKKIKQDCYAKAENYTEPSKGKLMLTPGIIGYGLSRIFRKTLPKQANTIIFFFTVAFGVAIIIFLAYMFWLKLKGLQFAEQEGMGQKTVKAPQQT